MTKGHEQLIPFFGSFISQWRGQSEAPILALARRLFIHIGREGRRQAMTTCSPHAILSTDMSEDGASSFLFRELSSVSKFGELPVRLAN